MNLLSSFAARFKALFTLADTTLPAPPPEPSCFIKGLVKSLREDPEETWVEAGNMCGGTWFSAALRHHELVTRVWMRWRWSDDTDRPLPGCTWLKEVGLTYLATPQELALIAQALEAKPRHQFKRHIEAQQAAEALLRRTNDYFTKLGCPDAS